MIKVKRDYYSSLTVLCILIGILIGGFLYLFNHATHHKDYAIYYYMAAFLLFIPGCVLGVIIKAEIYCFPLKYAAAKETLEAMKPKLVWTKEMIDYMRMSSDVFDFTNTFPIRINTNNYSYSSIIMGESSGYTGQTCFDKIDYYEKDGTPNVDAYEIKETYELLAQVDVMVTFYNLKDLDNLKYLDSEEEFTEQLRNEAYKNGYMAFSNPIKDDDVKLIVGYGSKAVAIICLNEECGIKEKIDSLFTKSKMFNLKYLNISIEYDGKSMEGIEYDKFCSKENRVPIKGISLGERFTLS